jgi:hypothetical protein
MSDGIGKDGLPTEYERVGHTEIYSDPVGERKYSIVVGGIYRMLPGSRNVGSIALASPLKLFLRYIEGYGDCAGLYIEGLPQILEIAEVAKS